MLSVHDTFCIYKAFTYVSVVFVAHHTEYRPI